MEEKAYKLILLSYGLLLIYSIIGPEFEGVPSIVEDAWIETIREAEALNKTLLRSYLFVYYTLAVVGLAGLWWKKVWGLALFGASALCLLSSAYFLPWVYETSADSVYGALVWLVQGLILAGFFWGRNLKMYNETGGLVTTTVMLSAKGAEYMSGAFVKVFEIGRRVQVSSEGGWKQDCLGTITGGPEPVETLKGPDNYYWVEFDEPQEDINGPDSYSKAQILSCYLSETT